jgi:hypothetical protein
MGMRRSISMLRFNTLTALLTSSLLFGLLFLPPVDNASARAVGVVATVTSVDTRTGTATLTTAAGEVYTMAKDSLWNVGTRVQCERVEYATPVRLQRCLPWQ